MVKQKHSDLDRLLAALSYVWVLFVIPYTIGHHKPFVFRHAQQGLALFVFETLLMIVVMVPLLGWVAGGIGWVFAFICAILGIGHALAGQEWQTPFLDQFLHQPNRSRGRS